MKNKRLPIGIQTFSKIIEGDYIYIDKTQHALSLIRNYQYVFLSRPRRFGKSLFVDTLNEIFNGRKELFKDLYIGKSDYDFEQYPVIRIDWSGDFTTHEGTLAVAREIMYRNQKRLGLECRNSDPGLCFAELIEAAYERYGKQVVILIDEYDKPILDNLGNVAEAEQRRNFLRGMYVQMKSHDRYIRFAFLTGISRFSKASIFSGLNNLEDISLNPDFATICGYTQYDLDTSFAEYLKGADMDRVRQWYNGYNFLGENVYNPFDILKFIRNDYLFYPYWWESGTPFSLIEFLKKGKYYIPKLENLVVDSTILSSFDIEKLRLEALLFQAGYLTIDKVIRYDFTEEINFKLRVPNKEVQISLNRLFYEYLTDSTEIDKMLIKALYEGDLQYFKDTVYSLFASIPYNNYVKNNLAAFEGYYASVIYTYLTALGVQTIAEDVTDKGRIDLTILAGERIYIIEFKVCRNGCAEVNQALEQIRLRRYWEKYRSPGKTIYLVGIEFDEEKKNIARFDWEVLNEN